MAYIDLKNVSIYVEDGYSVSGTVGTGGASIGATTVPVVVGANVVIDAGVFLKIGTDDTQYTVLTHTETTGSTTSVTVSPALVVAATAAAAVVFGPHQLKIKIGDGNLTYDEKRAIEYKKDRGLLDQTRLGDQDPIDVNLSFAWEYLSSPSGATTPTFEEALKQEGPAANWLSTGTNCEPYSVNIVLRNLPPSCTLVTDVNEDITLPKFLYESLSHDPKAGTVTCQGKCNALKAIKVRY